MSIAPRRTGYDVMRRPGQRRCCSGSPREGFSIDEKDELQTRESVVCQIDHRQQSKGARVRWLNRALLESARRGAAVVAIA